MAVKIEKRSFGKTARGENVTLFEIGTPELTARVLDYGATVQALLVMDKNGKPVDVVLGHDTIEGYETHDGYLGACVGRVANRIGGAEFTLNGKTYPLAKNDGQNHLHGGLRGFDKYVWDAEILEESAGRVYVSFLLNDDGAPVFTNKVCAEAGEAPDYVIVPEFEPGLSRLGQDAAWFRAREAAQEWPGLTWNGTSIYDLLLDELKTVYGEPERISHEPFLQEEYYDVVEFPDGSQAGGICFVDTSVTKPNAAYLRLYDGTDACGVTAGEDYREAANRFPRAGLPAIYRVDEHTALLLLGGEVRYMGKYSLIEYTDGEPTTLMICDETAMRFQIEDSKIAAVSYHAPEEAKQLPLTRCP